MSSTAAQHLPSPSASRQRIVDEEQQRLFGGGGGVPLLQGGELGFDVDRLTGAALLLLLLLLAALLVAPVSLGSSLASSFMKGECLPPTRCCSVGD